VSFDEARAKSQDTWDRMAAGWQKHSDFMWATSRQVGEWLVDHVDPQPGQTILDIAAGPGWTGFVAAGLVGDEGKLISTDFAEEMVNVAATRAKELGLTNVECRTMDAEKMDLPDDSIDGAICRWGYMLMLDPQSALKETRRVLKDGGNLAFSVWGSPVENPWVTLVGMVLTQQGHPPQADPFGPGGMFSMADPDTIRAMATDAGFNEVTVEDMEVHWKFPTFEDVWGFMSELVGAVATLMTELSDEEIQELRGQLQAAAETDHSDSGYDFPGVTRNVLAR
jgi:ubiquinone/menaquinone biosynthesis C-methylase UbiE